MACASALGGGHRCCQKSPAITEYQAHRGIAIAHLCNNAMHTGRKMRLNSRAEQIVGDEMASR